ncbi:MAG: hypothetical protein KatS3mg087_2043 [Patescibacteria group bacterium]|nr:MAG: hypothetical protein KatS3mg087_2043 [Patescibacteria group bacterium]
MSGGGNKVFDIVFGVQRGAGRYELVLGPQIEDERGNRMNQDGDGVNGEDPGDRYVASVELGESGPRVVDAQWGGLEPFTLDRLRVTFDKAINVNTFTSGDIVSFVGPGGRISTSYQITAVSGGGNKVFDIVFGVQRGAGRYELVLGPQIEDERGNRMNQDGDGVNGEDPGDRYVASVELGESGPKVVDAQWGGSEAFTLDRLRVTFDKAINVNTFTSGDIVSFVGPNGSISTSYQITAVSGGGNKVFDIVFGVQRGAGRYELVLGPQIEDERGNRMNQDGDGVNGEDPGDRYVASVELGESGPRVVDAQWGGLEPFTLDRLRVTFDKAINVNTFTSGDIVSFVGPGGRISTSYQITAVSGGGNKVFDIVFGVQRGAGRYELVLGPQIEDERGNRMNQDGDGVNGEDPGDRYVASVELGESGPKVVDAQWGGSEAFTLDRLRVTFDKAINVNTFTSGDIVSFVGPNGSISTSYQITAVSGGGNKVFDIVFGVQRGAGRYELVLGPQIEDERGNRMNQDGDGVNGEDPGDRYVASVELGESGPRVVDAQWGGLEPFTLDRLRVTFDKAINVNTFTSGDIVSFVGPGGSISTSYQITAVSGGGNKVFDIVFGVQRGAGRYELVLGPQIEDERGNRMNQDGDGVNGEDPGDRYVASVELGESGPRVIDAQFRGSNPRMFDSVRLTFSEPIKPSSFTEDDIVEFTGPNGTISTSYTIVPVNGSNDTQFDILFAKQNRQGTYRMTVGPFIEDSLGNYMNQNGDHINGQIPEDRFILEQYLDTSKTKRYDAWKVNRPIRDYRVTRSAITITEAITISDLSVRVNLNHSATGDLRIRLIGPQNQSVVLFDRHGKNGDNLRNTWFSDSADISISQGKPPYNGNYRSIQSLSMFHNSLAAGKWILEVRDTKSGNVGKLLSWSLVVTGTMEDGEGGGMGGMMSAFDNSACVWPVYYLPPSASNGDHSEEWNWADPIEVG